MINVIHYEAKLLLRNRAAVIACLCFLGVGTYALYYGKSFLEKQTATINRIDTAYQNRVQRQVRNFTADTTTQEGKDKYKYAHDAFMNEWFTRPMIWKQPSPMQAMSIGQSDTQPFFYNLWVYNNIYNSKYLELRNPEKLMAGNFDLAFVIIYLLPLLIIALTFGILSEDRESGISPIAFVQGATAGGTLCTRLGFRLVVVGIMVVVLSVAGFRLNGVQEVSVMVSWVIVASLYTLFWFALTGVITALQNSSAGNALALVSIWVAVLIFIPTVVHSMRDVKDPERLRLSDASREVSRKLWAMERKRIVDTLYQVMPRWEKYASNDTNEIRSTAYAYLLQRQMNLTGRAIDRDTNGEEQKLRSWNIINPAFTAQLALNSIAKSEIDQFLAFREAAAAYQERRMENLYDIRLSKRPFTRDVFKSYPRFTPNDYETPISLWNMLQPLIILTAVLLVTGALIIRTKEVIVFNT